MEAINFFLNYYEIKLSIHLVLYLTLTALGAISLRTVKKFKWSWFKQEGGGNDLIPAWSFGRISMAIAAACTYFTILGVIVLALIGILTSVAKVQKVVPAPSGTFLAYNSPISADFDVPIDINKLRVYIKPSIEFELQSDKYIQSLPYARRIKILPKVSYPPGENIMIYLSDIKNPLSQDYGSEYLVEYQTADLPEITMTEPLREARGIAPDRQVVVYLSGYDTPQSIWEVDIAPPHPYEIKKTNMAEFTIRFKELLQQNTTYRLTFYRTPAIVDMVSGTITPDGERSQVYDTEFTTIKAPLVAAFVPIGEFVLITSPIEITFDEPMEPVSIRGKFTLSPEATINELSWSKDNTKLTLLHAGLTKDTVYTAKLSKGISSIRGGVLDRDLTFAFRTIGKVRIENPTPAKNQSVSVNTTVMVPFDQPVDEKDAERKFSITPATEGTFTWQKTSMMFKPKKPFKNLTTYSWRIAKGVKSIYGIDSDQTFEYSFTTGPAVFSLNVHFFRQEESFTCNIAAARQLLAYRGVQVSEQQLKNEIGSAGGRDNGNPNQVHVPDYGTYWDPIMRGVTKYRSARLYQNWTLNDILGEVAKGNPVMIWGQNGWSDPHEISWTNPDGTYIYAINGMHSFVVRGYRGPINNPTHILVNDPWRGVYALDTVEFNRRWSYFKVALVVD